MSFTAKIISSYYHYESCNSHTIHELISRFVDETLNKHYLKKFNYMDCIKFIGEYYMFNIKKINDLSYNFYRDIER